MVYYCLELLRTATRWPPCARSAHLLDVTHVRPLICADSLLFYAFLVHLETLESLDMVYTWYILGIYF